MVKEIDRALAAQIKVFYRSTLYLGGTRGRKAGPQAAVQRTAKEFKMATYDIAKLVRNI